jgi:hypothetical protein
MTTVAELRELLLEEPQDEAVMFQYMTREMYNDNHGIKIKNYEWVEKCVDFDACGAAEEISQIMLSF